MNDKKNSKTIEKQINEFLNFISDENLNEMFSLMFESFQLFDVDENDDWVKDSISNKDEVSEIRLLKSVHLLSKMAELYTGKLLKIKVLFPNLYLKMEQQAKQL